MIIKRVLLVLLLVSFIASCVGDEKEVSFKWDQSKDKEEIELLVRFMDAYPLVFKESTKQELQQLFILRTSLLEGFNKGVYSDNDLRKYWTIREDYFNGLDISRVGGDRFEKRYEALINEEPKSFMGLSEFIYNVFRSDKNEVKSIVANQIQAQNSVK